jgi:hypothetical protein
VTYDVVAEEDSVAVGSGQLPEQTDACHGGEEVDDHDDRADIFESRGEVGP